MNEVKSNSVSSWLKIDDSDSIFFWLHQAIKSAANPYSIGVVIVGPIGPEYMHTHKSVKWLANTLAESGIPSVRYDPIGMGNSSGDLFQEKLFDKWVSTPQYLKKFMLNNVGVEEVVFIGMRSGSLILSKILVEESSENVIHWYPYTDGRVYLRDIKLIDKMLIKEEKEGEIIEGGGYPLTQECQQKLSQINLSKIQFRQSKNIFLIENNGSTNKKVLGNLEGQAKLEVLESSGLNNMIKIASLSQVPKRDLDTIKNWVLSLTKSTLDLKDSRPNNLSSRNFSERTIEISECPNLYGIFCEPNIDTYQGILLLVNAGSGHHVGPNRMNVDIARLAAKNNLASYRFDLGHLGDSHIEDIKLSNNPYSPSSIKDILAVIQFFSKKYNKKIYLAGLCSGAHNFFHAALQTNSRLLDKLIIINPLTFYWKEGQSILEPEDNRSIISGQYYNQQTKDLKKWLSLLTSPKKVINIITFIFLKAKAKLNKIMLKASLLPKNQLETDLLALKERNIELCFLFSDGDPGHAILLDQTPGFIRKNKNNNLLKIKVIKNSDHTFSSVKSRKSMIDALLDVLI